MFEVGKKYTADNWEYECLLVRGDYAWLAAGNTSPAYVWRMDGTSVSLGDGYNITPTDPRDQEIAALKTRISVLEAMAQ